MRTPEEIDEDNQFYTRKKLMIKESFNYKLGGYMLKLARWSRCKGRKLLKLSEEKYLIKCRN